MTAAEAASPGPTNDSIPIGLDSADADRLGDDESLNQDSTRRNFVSLACYQVIVRIGWIFKTESVIIPAFMDLIGGGALMRGCLPLFNRFGHSVPPILLARRVKITPQKRFGVVVLTMGMAICFLTLGGLWFMTGGERTAWMPFAFLVLYALFFVFTGINQLFFSTLQGKVIPASSRGRQMWVANITGAIFAICFAFWLLPRWLTEDAGRFEMIFCFAGSCFAISTLVVFFIREPKDDYQDAPLSLRELSRQTLRGLRLDRNLRRSGYAAICFGSGMMLFPHYQALARTELELDLTNLMVWVVVQNSGTAIFSFVTGWLADRYGNRLALRCAMILTSGGPALAILLAMIGPAAKNYFAFVFLLVGMTPVTIKLFTNYALELSAPADHARYVSTLGLCFSFPILLFSPLVGFLIGQVGFLPPFACLLCVILSGFGLTFAIVEPRHKDFVPFRESESIG